MKAPRILAFAFAVVVLCPAALATPVGPGDISGTWTAADSPYVVGGHITVPYGETLDIEPGVEVRFAGNYVLAIIGVVTSLISAYYYLRVVVTMYMQEGEPETEREFWLGLTTSGTALMTVLISLVPQGLFAWVSAAVLKLF